MTEKEILLKQLEAAESGAFYAACENPKTPADHAHNASLVKDIEEARGRFDAYLRATGEYDTYYGARWTLLN